LSPPYFPAGVKGKALCEMVEDARDVGLVREAREHNKGTPGISIQKMKRRLGWSAAKKRKVDGR
jgi:hypothetical protein